MAEQFIIRGGKTLAGEIVVCGSKNAVLPLIAATLLTAEPCVLDNVPDIRDVEIMLAIASGLGSTVVWDRAAHHLEIQSPHLASNAPDEPLCRKLRGAVLFAGALLSRMRKVAMPYPGGDAIGARPLDTHLHAFEALGAVVESDTVIRIDGSAMAGSTVVMDEPSVTATENAILAAVGIKGRTIISLGALEPHVQELVGFLRAMGADIGFRDLAHIEINGAAPLGGARWRVNPDELEISGFAALAAATRSEIIIRGIAPEYLDSVFLQLRKMGVVFSYDAADLRIMKPALGYKSFRIQSGLYPKLGSDHLPPFAVLATQARGVSLIHDWMYENRLRYIPELQKMGATCEILDPHRALITGPATLAGCAITSVDIRSGMTLVIAALVAEGESSLGQIEHIDRGYEKIDERLRSLGADIKRVDG
ncbi:MAG: UDP-N-acetylglucosamine 1-carboxyvinyltransferase [Candidatus Sungiibacteriota bacterium]